MFLWVQTDFKLLIGLFWKKNSTRDWKLGRVESSLSSAGTITLINSCLSNSPIFHMSMYLLPKTIIKNINVRRRAFLWQGGSNKKISFGEIGKSVLWKEKGIGYQKLENLNISLMCKWWCKLENDGVWHEIIKKKYIQGKNIQSISHSVSYSLVWKYLLKVNPFYLRGRQIIMKFDDKTRSREDT